MKVKVILKTVSFYFRQSVSTKMTIRSMSESSEFSDLEVAGVEPITLDDISFNPSYAVENFG